MRCLNISTALSLVVTLMACKPTRELPEPSPKNAEQVERPGSAPAVRDEAPSPASQGAPFAAISGTIALAPGLDRDVIRDGDVIFVMARTQEGGDLVATEIIESVELPATFRLDDADIMVHGTQAQPPYMVSARLDRDQDAMTRGDDDLYALHETPIRNGAEGLELVLMKKPADAIHGGELDSGGAKVPMDGLHGGGASSRPSGN